MCKMNALPAARLPPSTLEAYFRLREGPNSRESLGRLLDVSPSRVTRHLQELLNLSLIIREAHGRYQVPTSAARRLLIIESSPYHRELILLNDVYRARRRAFACARIRDAFRMELPHPVVVLPLDNDVTHDDPGLGLPTVARMNLPEGVKDIELRFPGDEQMTPARLTVPVLPPAWSLAVFAVTGDADLIAAAREAAPELGVPFTEVSRIARTLRVELGTVSRTYPNLLIHAEWLRPRIEAGRSVLAKRSLSELLQGAG